MRKIYLKNCNLEFGNKPQTKRTEAKGVNKYFQNFKMFLLLFLSSFFAVSLSNAQSSVTTGTPYSMSGGSGGAALISFIITNNNAYEIEITDIDHYARTSENGHTFSLWYTTSLLSGTFSAATQPAAMPAGWTLASTGVATVPANGIVPVFSNIKLKMAANTTYRFVVRNETGTSIGYGGSTGTPNNFTNAGVMIGNGNYVFAGQNVGYWNGSITPRFWCGTVYSKRSVGPGVNDAGIEEFVGPVDFCPGTKNIELKVKNYGVNQINSLKVAWEYDGVRQTDYNLSSLLDIPGGAGSDEKIISLGSRSFDAGVLHTLKAWTYDVNGGVGGIDTVNFNDTIKADIMASLSGSVTIDASSPTGGTNFTSVTDFMKALNGAGLCGALKVSIASGTYVGQWDLDDITNASAVNKITIESATGNPDDVLLQFAANSSGNNFVIRLKTPYVTFKNVSVQNTGASYNSALLIDRGGDYGTFENVKFIGRNINSTAANYYVVYTTTGAIVDYLTFKGCKFIDGSYGMYMYSASSNAVGGSSQNLRVENCEFIDQYYMGIRVYYYAGLQFHNNLITSSRTYSSFRGMYLYWIMCPTDDNKTTIDGNKIFHNEGGYGMYLEYLGVNTSFPTAVRHFRISNNVINMGPGSGVTRTTRGMYLVNQSNSEYFHNTIHVASNDASNSAAFWFQSPYTATVTQGRVDVKNNLFTTDGNASPVYLSGTNMTPTNVTIDNNNLYTTGSYIGNYSGSLSSNINSWRSASGYDVNSMDLDPMYQDLTFPTPNMHLTSRNLHDEMPYMSSVKEDAEKRVRKATGTDPGGLQSIDDVSLASISSVFNMPYCGGTYPVTLNIVNTGNFDFNGYLKLRINLNNGKLIKNDSINIRLAAGESIAANLPQDMMFNGGRVNNLEVTILNPDENMTNNSASMTTPFLEITPSGSELTETSTGNYKYPSTAEPFWKSVANETIEFNVSTPNGFTAGDYNKPTGYTVDATAYLEKDGSIVPSTTTYTQGASNGVWTLNVPDKTYDGEKIIYELYIQNAVSGCDTSLFIDLMVVDDGTPDFDITSLTCEDTKIIIENKSSVSKGYLTYKWDFGDGNTSNLSEPTPIYTQAGTYTITMTTKTVPFGFERKVTKSITINATPKADFDATSQCYGEPLLINNKTTNIVGTPDYDWDFGDGQTSTMQTPIQYYNSVGEYTVNVTVTSDKGCNSSMEKIVFAYPIPVVDFTVPALTCMSTNSAFINNTTIDFTNWSSFWDFGANEGTSNDVNPVYNFKQRGTTQVKLVSTSEFGCSDSVTKSVMVEPSPVINITHNDACVDYPTLFNGNVDVPSGLTAEYNWEIDGKSYSDEIANVVFTYADIKKASLTVTFSNGCAKTESVSTQSAYKPTASFDINGATCAGQSVDIVNGTLIKFGRAVNYWNMGDGNTYFDIVVPNHSYNNNKPENVTITLIATNNLGTCADTFSKSVALGVVPDCNFNINDVFIPGHRGYEFNTSAATGLTYEWNFDDGSKSSERNPTHQYSRDGVYNVSLTVTSDEGCSCTKKIAHSVVNLSVSDILSDAGIVVYPNPTNGIVNISNTGNNILKSVNVLNAVGSVIYSQDVYSNEFSIDLTDRANGVYMIQLHTESGQVLTQKIVVSK